VLIQGSAMLRGLFGSSTLALDQAIYGLLLVLFIIFMPKGILGTAVAWRKRRGAGIGPGRAVGNSASARR
jgi:branched-chain amino acid transport system permease protein